MTVEIVLLALVALFVGLRLYAVLGRRTGHEQQPVTRPETVPGSEQPAPLADAAPERSEGGGLVYEEAAAGGKSLSDADIEQRVQARIDARKAKNWAESDRIRDELAQAGVILEDKPGGVTNWRRA